VPVKGHSESERGENDYREASRIKMYSHNLVSETTCHNIEKVSGTGVHPYASYAVNTHSKQSPLPPFWVINLLLAVFLVWIVLQLKEIFVLLVMGYAVAYFVDPLLGYLEQKKISRGVGFILVFGFLIVFITLSAVTALPTLFSEYDNLIDKLPEYITSASSKVKNYILEVRSKLPPEYAKYVSEESLSSMVPNFGEGYIPGILQGIFGALLKGYSVTLTLFNLTFLPFIAYYLAVDFKNIHSYFFSLVPFKYQSSVKEIFGKIDENVSAFVRGQIIVCSILFLLYALGLGIIGVELWFLLAVISGFGNIIPYFGFVTGFLLSTVLALATYGDLYHIYLVWGVYIIVQLLEGTFITPKILGDKVGLSPLVVILSIFAAGKLFGLLGIFLAIPIASAIKVIGYYSHRWFVQKI
jgi:predicted PurR-regulated permease PerM